MHENSTDNRLARRTIKDSVFCHLFRQPKYMLQLYRVLHPEDTTVTEKDFRTVTLDNVLADGWINDLGFLVEDRLIVLVEAQSTWSPNIIIRGAMYLLQTYWDYLEEDEIRRRQLYSSAKVDLPRAELYVVYTGDSKSVRHGEVLSLTDEFFGGNPCSLDVSVTILRGSQENNILQQYVRFCEIVNAQYREHGRTLKAIRETISICKAEDVLTDYLAFHEKEVYDIMRYLLSQEQITNDRLNAVRQESIQEGLQQGLQQEFLRSLKKCHELGFALPIMVQVTERTEEEVIQGLNTLGLPIPS